MKEIPQTTIRTSIFSYVIFFVSCVAAGIFIYTAVAEFPYWISRDSEGWGSYFYKRLFAPVLAGGTFLLGVFPSAMIYGFQGRKRIDLISLYISGLTFGMIIISWIIIEPVRQMIMFGD